MDAVEFLKERIRMCANMDNCTSCGLYKEHTNCDTRCFTHPNEAVAAVEKWVKEHPVKTRQSEFLKMFPNAPMRGKEDLLDICPNWVDKTTSCSAMERPDMEDPCIPCLRKYWQEEIK